MKLELERWADGCLRLIYWDYVYGGDVIFSLTKDGAYLDIDGNPISVDLIAELTKLYQCRNSARERYP